jgi:methylated-DNA-[protein]-cysteine S-methyltransferase
MYYKTISSPIGSLRLMASERGLCAVLFNAGRNNRVFFEGLLEQRDDHPLLLRAATQLEEYFTGKRKQFDIQLDMRGTVFQIKSWRELAKIPYGQTITYGEQARRLGDAGKARAVGMANGRNPLPIIIPCHRVIGVSGSLTGFSGGLDKKEFLLSLEGVRKKGDMCA